MWTVVSERPDIQLKCQYTAPIASRHLLSTIQSINSTHHQVKAINLVVTQLTYLHPGEIMSSGIWI